MAFAVKAEVDTSDAVRLFSQLQESSYNTGYWINAQFVRQAKPIIEAVFIEAASLAGAGFPPQYVEHLLSVVQNIHIETGVIAGSSFVQLDLESTLGDYTDLQRGFHYHALSPTMEFIELPYSGEPLKNTPETRFSYWKAIVDGKSEWIGITDAGNVIAFPIDGNYDETIEARVGVWGEKAPEWLILEYGIDYYPRVHAQPVTENIRLMLGELWAEICGQAAAQTLGQAQLTPGFAYDRSGNPRVGSYWVEHFKGG